MSEGVGSNWVGFMGLTEVNRCTIPDDLDVLAIIPFGYPAKPVGKGVKNRKPLSEVAHRGSAIPFNNPTALGVPTRFDNLCRRLASFP